MKKAEDFGLKDHVVFLGYRKNPFKYMRHCDLCYLLCGKDLKCFAEAMACGVLVLDSVRVRPKRDY